MQIRGAIFDFNGTLIFDSHLHELAWQHFSLQMRGREFDESEISAHIHGRVNRHILEYIVGRILNREEVEKLASQKEELYRASAANLGDGFLLGPGVEQLLNDLTSHSIPITIATASDITNLNFFVQQLNLARWFDINKIIYDDGSFPGKPEPDIFLRAAEKINLSPAECVVIEDSISGLESARRAGAGRIIAIAPAERRQDILDSTAADLVIETFEEIDLALLLGWSDNKAW